MATPAEIQFIIRMRDEASRVLNALGGQFGKAGQQAKGLETRFQGLAGAAAEAGRAISGAFATNIGGRATIGIFAEYEQGMIGVAKTSGMTKKELQSFSSEFDVLARDIKGVSVQGLLEIAQTAGQMGITGTQGILKFTEVLAKLQTATNIVGEEGAQKLARVLTTAGIDISKNSEAVERFASTLVELGNNVPAREREILDLASSLAQSAAGFGLSATAMAGLSATAATLNFRPELFGAAIARTMTQLKEAALSGGEGMELLSEITGITQKEFAKLVTTQPEKAIEKFLEVLNAQGGDENSTLSTLQLFNLQAEENQRVLGTLGKSIKTFRRDMDMAYKASSENTALDKEYEQFAASMNANFQQMKNTAYLLGKELGVAIAPAVMQAMKAATEIIEGLTGAFRSLPEFMQGAVAASLILTPALVSLTAALKLLAFVGLGPVVAMLKGPFVAAVVAGRGALVGLTMQMRLMTAASLLPAAGIAGVAAAVVAAGVLVMQSDWFKEWVGENFSDEVLGRLDTAKDKVTAAFDWSVLAASLQVGRALLRNYMAGNDAEAGAAEAGKAAANAFGEAVRKEQAVQAQKTFEAQRAANGFATDPTTGVPVLSEDYKKAIDDLDEYTKAMREVEQIERALTAQRKINEQAPGASTARDVQDMDRLQRLYELRLRMADPVAQVTHELDKQIAVARANTGASKLELEVQKAILEVVERKGVITAAESDAIRERLALLGMEKANSSYRDILTEQQQQLANLKAIGTEARSRVEAERIIADLLKDNTGYTEDQLTAIRANARALTLLTDVQALVSTANPVGTANQEYIDNVKTLEMAMNAGIITADAYKQMTAQLERSTLGSRDPAGARIKEMREELKLLSLSKRERNVESQTLSEVNGLRDRGVVVTDEMTSAIKRYYSAIEAVNRIQGSGVQGWINDLGTMEERLGEITKSGLDGFADAFTDVLMGAETDFAGFLNNIARMLLNAAIKDAMAKTLKGFNIGGAEKELSAAESAVSEFERLKQNQIVQAATATVNAGVVNIGGEGLNSLIETIKGVPAPGSVTRSALPDLKDGNTPASGAARGSFRAAQDEGIVSGKGSRVTGPDQRIGSAFDVTKNALMLSPSDIVNIKKTVATEWVQSAGDMQGKGIIDTILNRTASGRWGGDVASVVNAKSQFSDINGRPAWQKGRDSVDDLPMSRIDSRTSSLVDKYLAERAGGAQSVVGDNLNYANPNYSDARNLGWINKLDGPVLGQGKAIHRHGTTPDLESARPGNFGIGFAQQGTVDPAAIQQANTAVAALNTNVVNMASATSRAATTQQTSASQADMASQRVAMAHQASGQSAQMSASMIEQARAANDNLGRAASTAAPAVQQASNALQQAGQAGTGGQMGIGAFSAGVTEAGSAAGQATPAMGALGQGLMGLIQKLLSGIGGGGGGGSAIGGLFSTVLGAIRHSGGSAESAPQDGFKALPAGAFKGAASTANGLKADEFPAVLQAGERVLTAKQQKAMRGRGGNAGGGGMVSNVFSPSIAVSVQGSAGQSQEDQEAMGQNIGNAINARVEAKFAEMLTRESRPGGTIARKRFTA